MRHRLIPTEERRQMHREYYARAIIVFICTLAVAVVAGAAALLPADIRARSADNAALLAVKVAQNSNDTSKLAIAESQLNQANTLLNALGSGVTQIRFSKIVRDIVQIHSPVQISSFAMKRQSTSTIEVTLQGIAPTRDDLLSFKARLESLSPGSTAELPIATLAKSVNVNFSLRLIETLQ